MDSCFALQIVSFLNPGRLCKKQILVGRFMKKKTPMIEKKKNWAQRSFFFTLDDIKVLGSVVALSVSHTNG